jgi:hypothetical protein
VTYPPNTQLLFLAIAAATPGNKELQRALLVGSYGESGWDPFDSGSGGGGAFGFTPPSYPASLETAPPSEQVAAILPAYQSAQTQCPSSITNPAARAQWIAIAGERPEFDTAEMATIERTNAPTTYGANSSYTVQNWDEIVAITTPKGKVLDSMVYFIWEGKVYCGISRGVGVEYTGQTLSDLKTAVADGLAFIVTDEAATLYNLFILGDKA